MPNDPGGAIQVLDNTVASINQALAQVLERVDDLKGLRGPVTIYDRLSVDAPLDPSDAVNLETLVEGFLTQPSQPFAWRNLGNTQRPSELEGEDSQLDPYDPTLWLLSEHQLAQEDQERDPHDPFYWLLGAGNEQGGNLPQNPPPNVAAASDLGTVLERYAAEDHTHGITTDSFTITGTGFTDPDPTGTALYALIGPVVVLFIPELTGTSDATTFTLTGIPAAIQPATLTGFSAGLAAVDNGSSIDGARVRINAASATWDVFPNAAGALWTAANGKGLSPTWLAYTLL